MAFIFFFLDILALKIDGAQAVPDSEPNCWIQILLSLANYNPCSGLPENTLLPHTLSTSRCLSTFPKPFHTQVKEVAEISRSCLTDKLNDFNNILDALPQYEVITRDKCFLNLVVLGMSAAALTLSTFNLAKISHLETQIVNT
jgi:hypothetical protein